MSDKVSIGQLGPLNMENNMHIEDLKDSTRALLPKDIDKDLAVTTTGGESIFLTGVFKNGNMIGFWSHSPWGRVRDQQQGWMVIDKDLNHIDSITTFSDGVSGQGLGENETFNEWRSRIKQENGKSIKLCPEWDNECFWRMQDC